MPGLRYGRKFKLPHTYISCSDNINSYISQPMAFRRPGNKISILFKRIAVVRRAAASMPPFNLFLNDICRLNIENLKIKI